MIFRTEGHLDRLKGLQKRIDEEVRKRANAKMIGERGMRSRNNEGGLEVPIIREDPESEDS